MLLLRIIKNTLTEVAGYPLIFTPFVYSNRAWIFTWAHGIQKKDFIFSVPWLRDGHVTKFWPVRSECKLHLQVLHFQRRGMLSPPPSTFTLIGMWTWWMWNVEISYNRVDEINILEKVEQQPQQQRKTASQTLWSHHNSQDCLCPGYMFKPWLCRVC